MSHPFVEFDNLRNGIESFLNKLPEMSLQGNPSTKYIFRYHNDGVFLASKPMPLEVIKVGSLLPFDQPIWLEWCCVMRILGEHGYKP